MYLEEIINTANKYYESNNIAFIYKKEVPIKVLKINNNKIVDAFFKEKSTLDFVGIYNGLYVEFDAKSTNLNYLPLANIHNHQIKHIKNILSCNGICFIIISINDEYYLLSGKSLLYYIDNYKRKSITYDYIRSKGLLIKYNYLMGLNYLDKLEEMNEKDKEG